MTGDGFDFREKGKTLNEQEIVVHRVTVNVVESGAEFFLVDSHGSKIQSVTNLASISNLLDESTIREWEWANSVQRMLRRWRARLRRHCHDPWQRRCESLAASFRLRQLSLNSVATGKRHFECYSTSNWSDATKRMWRQSNNRFRRHSRNGWTRWSHTVSNNHNKRKGGPYGR